MKASVTAVNVLQLFGEEDEEGEDDTEKKREKYSADISDGDSDQVLGRRAIFLLVSNVRRLTAQRSRHGIWLALVASTGAAFGR